MSNGPSSSRRSRQFSPKRSEQVANKRGDDPALIAALLAWFKVTARDLPWRRSGRAGARDPYVTLVSELMLQQTQVSRVLEKFEPFLRRFPTIQALAAAPEKAVLEAWSGLGYYRRAHLLHAAAKHVVKEHGGGMPQDVGELLAIPGIGAYTSGAIASLAFDEPAALVDGNVTRVLLRISAQPGKLGDRETSIWAWERARELIGQSIARSAAGSWNEALMELGATVCTPLGPKCEKCPVQAMCGAYRDGVVDEIPAPKDVKKRVKVYWATVVIRDREGRYLIKTRPASGLFAGMAEAPTLESAKRASVKEVLSFAREVCGQEIEVRKVGSVGHQLTHRELACDVYAGEVVNEVKGEWVAAKSASDLALSNIQRKILMLARGLAATPK